MSGTLIVVALIVVVSVLLLGVAAYNTDTVYYWRDDLRMWQLKRRAERRLRRRLDVMSDRLREQHYDAGPVRVMSTAGGRVYGSMIIEGELVQSR